MDFFVTDTRGMYIINQPDNIWVERKDNTLYLFNNYNRTEYTRDLIKLTLASSGCEGEVEGRLHSLTKLNRFDFVIIRNSPTTTRVALGYYAGEGDQYQRDSRIALAYVKEDKVTHPDVFRSFTIADEDTRKVLARLPKITDDVLNALVTAGVIKSWEYLEYPWVSGFTFTQPKGSTPPDDLRTHA